MQKARKPPTTTPLRTIQPNAAGIDLGSKSHFVALPPGRCEEVVREFGCFTENLEAMATWLLSNGITTIAMEATGVYWVPVFEVLERRGLDVQLVSTKHLRGVPGRKTDVLDCQWIQHLHECGLLRGSFRPPDIICVVRGFIRHKASLVEESTRRIQRLQKALDQMNLQLHKVVADITGATGMAIIKAIIAGERDPEKLAALRNYRCKRDQTTMAKALVGNWREEHLFCLKQELAGYQFIQDQIQECDAQALKVWTRMEQKAKPEDAPKPKSHHANRDVHQALFGVTGTNLASLPGFSTENLQTLIAEVGVDMSKWTSAKAFANWATLAPRNNITGGKRRRAGYPAGPHRVAQCFRVAAQTLANSKTAFGAFYRRMRGRKGSALANHATAHKLARLFHTLLSKGETYVERGIAEYETRYRGHLIRNAVRQLHRLGVPLEPTVVAGLPHSVP
jgi:transposase